MEPLTEKEQRVYERIGEIIAIKSGYDWRWVFRGSKEPVTRQITSMRKKGLLDVMGTFHGPVLIVKNQNHV